MNLIESFKAALDNMADSGKMELAKQGHRASGKLIESIEAKITQRNLARLVGVILAEDYGMVVDSGVSSSRVPFGGGSGGGTSQYIQALLEWASYVKPGLDLRERKSFVFAVANTHAKEGIPTRGSYAFSSNGRRKGWIEHGLENQEEQLEEDIRATAEALILSFDQAVTAAAA